jgi:hypothetical protein
MFDKLVPITFKTTREYQNYEEAFTGKIQMQWNYESLSKRRTISKTTSNLSSNSLGILPPSLYLLQLSPSVSYTHLVQVVKLTSLQLQLSQSCPSSLRPILALRPPHHHSTNTYTQPPLHRVTEG